MKRILHVSYTGTYVLTGVKIRRALGPMDCKIACRPSKLILGGPGRANFVATLIPL